MKAQSFLAVLGLTLLAILSGCSVVEGIFKAGMGVGIFIVLAVIVLIAFVVMKTRKK